MQFAIMNHVEGADGSSASSIYNDVIEQALAADRAGFDVAWFGEHHFGVHQGFLPRPLLLALAITERTRMSAGAAVSVVPLQHPLDLAEEIAVADTISGGRIETGLGSGSFATEFEAFRVPLEERRERFAEALPIIVRALSGERCAHNGTHYQISDVVLRPCPERSPTEFLWVGASGEHTAKVAGQLGLGLMLPRGRAADAYGETITAYRHAHREAGFDPASARVAVTRCVLIDDSMSAAKDSAELALHRFYRQWSKSAEKESVPSYDEIVSRLNVVVGNSEACRSELALFCRSVDLTHLTIQFAWGGLQQATALKSIDLFGQHVLPYLRRSQVVGQV